MKACGSHLVAKVLGIFVILYFCSNGHVVNGQTVRLDSADVSNDLTTLTLRICFTNAQSGPGVIFVTTDQSVISFSSGLVPYSLSINNENQECKDYPILVTISRNQIGKSTAIFIESGSLSVSMTVGDNNHSLFIPGVFFDPVSYSTPENSRQVSLHICRLPIDVGLTITLMYSPGTAIAIADYNIIFTSVEIAAASQCADFFIPIVDDSLHEGTEVFTISVSVSEQSSFMVSSSQGTATVTIMDNEVNQVFFDPLTYEVEEPSSATTAYPLTICHSVNSIATTLTFTANAVSATIGMDFLLPNTQVTIPVGDDCADISVTIYSDTIRESDETFQIEVTAMSPDVVMSGQGTATVTILDDDSVNQVFFDSLTYEVEEPNSATTTLPLSICRSVTNIATTLTVTANAVSATIGMDFILPNALVTIPVGDECADISVIIYPDTIRESDESFQVEVTARSLDVVVVFGQGTAVVTILDDDPAVDIECPIPSLTIYTNPGEEITDFSTYVACSRGMLSCSSLSSESTVTCLCTDDVTHTCTFEVLMKENRVKRSPVDESPGTTPEYYTTTGMTTVLGTTSMISSSTDDRTSSMMQIVTTDAATNNTLVTATTEFYTTNVTESTTPDSTLYTGTTNATTDVTTTGTMATTTDSMITDPCNPHPCDSNAYCTSDGGNFNCTCYPGYTGNGNVCTACDHNSGGDRMYGQNCSFPCTCASKAICNIVSGACSGVDCDGVGQTACDKNNLSVTIANDTVTVNENETISLVCTVNLGPDDVTVTWEPAGNTIPPDNMKGMTTYTLVIPNAMASNSGQYTCIGTLNVPTGNVTSVSDTVRVDVKVQGEISTDFEELKKASIGENVTLTCEAFGNPQPNVTWLHENGHNFSDNVVQSSKEVVSLPFCCDVTRELNFMQLTNENNGTYTCTVTVDGMVSSSKNVDLIVIDFPEIDNLEIVQRAATSLMLTWQVTDYGQDDGVECTANYTENNEDDGMSSTNCEEKSCKIQNLTPDTEYHISVVCRNDAGPSNTETETARTIRSTPEEVPELRPIDGTDSVNSTSIVVKLPDEISEENGQISCYEFVVAVDHPSEDPDDDYPFTDVLDKSGGDESAYRAVVMDRSTFKRTQTVVIGMASSQVTTCELTDPTRTRKRRSLVPPQTLTATNDLLDSEQSYNIFLRVYVPSGENYDYKSSEYLEFETIAVETEASNLGGTLAVVFIVLIVIVIVASVTICIIWRRFFTKDQTGSNRNVAQKNSINDTSTSTLYMNEQQTSKVDASSYEPVQSQMSYELQLKQIAKTHSASQADDTYEFEHTAIPKEGTALPTLPVSQNLDAVIYEEMPDEVNYSHALYSVEKAPVPFKVSELPKYIQQKRLNERYGLEKEFMVLPKGQLEPWTEALKRHNVGRSRKADVLPYDSSRVKLVFDSKQQSDFYNASFVMDQHNRQSFIAAQSPSEDTVYEFLWMIWQERVSIIIMISDLHESGKDACFPYWPMQEGKTKRYGKLSVILKRSIKYPDHAVREFLIQNKEEDYIAVTQFQYHSWPYQGVAQHPTSLFYFIKDVKMCLKKKHFPLLVHCSDGAGATGTFIASFCLLDEISQSSEISVYNFVKKMRKNRMNLVSTKDQYVLIYDVLLMEYNSPVTVYSISEFKRLIISKKKVSVEFQSLQRPNYQIDAQSGSSKKNKNRNRFHNIIPLDISRPRLQSGSALGGGDYINACFANSYFKKNAFILTQSPLPVTVEDFWRMVYEQKSSKILMLNQLDPADKTCNFYWPNGGNVQYGSIMVDCFSTVTNDLFVCREMGVNHQDEEGLLKVKHFQLLKWPQGKTDVSDLMDFFEVVGFSEGTESVIIHCLDGVGRSGIFITIHNELQRLKDTEKVDIYQSVQSLRERNPFICSTLKEYLLCYEALQAFVERGRYF